MCLYWFYPKDNSNLEINSFCNANYFVLGHFSSGSQFVSEAYNVLKLVLEFAYA